MGQELSCLTNDLMRPKQRNAPIEFFYNFKKGD
jgi:hypothetical protein